MPQPSAIWNGRAACWPEQFQFNVAMFTCLQCCASSGFRAHVGSASELHPLKVISLFMEAAPSPASAKPAWACLKVIFVCSWRQWNTAFSRAPCAPCFKSQLWRCSRWIRQFADFPSLARLPFSRLRLSLIHYHHNMNIDNPIIWHASKQVFQDFFFFPQSSKLVLAYPEQQNHRS